MSELSVLQEIILRILGEHAKKDLLEVGKGRCELKNEQIFNLIDSSMRPATVNYITSVLNDLEKKGKVKRETRHFPGRMGMKRVITLL